MLNSWIVRSLGPRMTGVGMWVRDATTSHHTDQP